MKKFIQVFKPSMGQEEIREVAKVIKSGWIGLGPKTEEFEKRFASFIGSKYAVGLSSATAALHLSLLSLGIKKGDEVLLPSLTFVSTAHAVLYVGAKPVFVDIYPDTLCINIEDLKKKISSKTKVIIPVHYGGHPCKMDKILTIARKNNLFVVEDAAHACGAEYKGKKIGSLKSDSTCFSFHAVKNLATGDGGMVTTNKKRLAQKIRNLRWVGINKDTWKRTKTIGRNPKYRQYGWYYEVIGLGYKYHMNDIIAAIGLIQLKKLKKTNKKRYQITQTYNKAFEKIPWITTPIVRKNIKSAYHNYVIKTPYRDKLNLYLRKKGIATGVHYLPVHLHPYYQKKIKAQVPVTEKIWKRLLTLPLYPDLSKQEIRRVITAVNSFKP